MRILLIHQAFASPNEPGGTRHYELAIQTIKQGHEFTIVASDLSYLTGKSAVDKTGMVTKQDINGIRVLRAYTYPSLHRSFVWRVVSFLSFMLTSIWAGLRAGDVDLVIGTTPPIFQTISAWLVSALRRKPFLLEVRDLWPEFAIGMGVLHNPILIWTSRKLEAFLYARANHILVNSPAYRDYLMTKGVAEQKISLIANGVDVGMFRPALRGETFRERWNLDNAFVVTYAGALGIANDIPTILRAAQHLQDNSRVRFLVVGDGKERTELEQLSKQLGLQNVIFTGSVPKSQMQDVLAATDVCVATLQNIPMFRTTYPNKVFDYMAAGRPTILGIDGVIREVIEAANGGIAIPPGNDVALADAVVKLLDDPSLVAQMGANAREYVIQHFDRQQQAQRFVALLEEMQLHAQFAPKLG